MKRTADYGRDAVKPPCFGRFTHRSKQCLLCVLEMKCNEKKERGKARMKTYQVMMMAEFSIPDDREFDEKRASEDLQTVLDRLAEKTDQPIEVLKRCCKPELTGDDICDSDGGVYLALFVVTG